MRILKILFVIPVVIWFYFLLIFVFNYILNTYYKNVVLGDFGVVKFENARLGYLFNLKIRNITFSNKNFSVFSKETIVSFDLRKLFIGKLPIGLIDFRDVDLKLVSNSIDLGEANEVNLYYYLDKLSKSKFMFDKVRVYYGDWVVIVDKLKFNIHSGSIVSFDLLSDVSYGIGDVVKFFKSSVSFSGIVIFKTNNNFTLSSKLEIKNSEVMGNKIEDIRMNLFTQNGTLVGVCFSENYNGELKYKDGVLVADFLLRNIARVTNSVKEFNYISILPDSQAILSSLLKGTYISLSVSNNYFGAYLYGTNAYGFLRNVSNNLYAFFKYSDLPKRKYFSFKYDDNNAYIKLNNLNVADHSLDFKADLKIFDKGFRVDKSFIRVDSIYGNFLDNLVFSSNFIILTNEYISGAFDLDNSIGEFYFKSRLFNKFFPSLNTLFEVQEMKLNVSHNVISILGKGDSFSLSLLSDLSTKNIKINNFEFLPLKLSLRGNLSLTNKLSADLILAIGNVSIPLNAYYSGEDNILIRLRQFGYGSISTNFGSIKLVLTNFSVGALNFSKAFLTFSNKELSFSTVLNYSEYKFDIKVNGTLEDLRIQDSYIYAPQKIINFNGRLSFANKLKGELYLDDSKITVTSDDFKMFYIVANLKNFYFSYLVGVPLDKISGSFNAYLDVTKDNFYDMFEELAADLKVELLGLFYKSIIKVNKSTNSIEGSISLFDYFNVFAFNFSFRDKRSFLSKLKIYPRIPQESYIPQVISLGGSFENGVFEGKLDVNINGFSGLNESWSKIVRVSNDNVSVFGPGDGITFYKITNNILLYYTRDGKVFYTLKAFENKDAFSGTFEGFLPLNFILVPDFISDFKGKLFIDNLNFSLKKNGVLDLLGDGKIVIDNLKLDLVQSSFKANEIWVRFYRNNISIDQGILYNNLGKVGISAKLDLQNINNPFISLNVLTLSGFQNFYVNLGIIELRGPGVVSLNLSGSFDNPSISGRLNFYRDASIKFYFISSEDTKKDEKDFFNFAQIASWRNFNISFEDGVNFESEVINSKIEKGQVVVNGRVIDKSLSLSGVVSLSTGTMRYVGKFFDIDYIRLIFNGDEFNFVPYVVGEVYTYIFDKSNQENVKIIAKISGKANQLNPTFYSQPERTRSEIFSLLGIPTKSSDLVKEGLSLLETIGIYDFISYNVRKYTGLDMFYITSPIISSYLISLIENRSTFITFQDIMKLTELRIGKSILPTLFLEYKLGFDTLGNFQGYTNVLLHSFALNWYFKSLLFEFEYSSSVKDDKVEFEPKVNVKFNKRF
ncbi:MAG: translocation/assembly module TamB domain-containing protein [Brevinematia bacterium]